MPDITITPDEARRKGLVGPVYHGSPDFKGRKFDPKYRARSSGISRGGFSFSDDVASADGYAAAPIDSAQAAVDAANDVMRDLGARMESGLKLREFADVSELPEFNVRYADDMDELASYFNDLAKRIPKDLAARLRDAAKQVNEPANPVVVEAYLRNPKTMDIDGKKLWLVDNPDDIFVSAARPPQGAATGRARGQAMPDVAEAPPFFLKSSQALDAKIQGKVATPDQVKAILTNPQNGIKAEELKWTGVMQEVERLSKENNGKVPKEALLKYLAEDGAVRLEEVRLGQDKSRINTDSRYAIPEVLRYAQENQGNAPEAMLLAIENDGDVYRALGRQTPELLEREDWAQVVVNDVFGGGDNVQLGRYAQYQLPGGENYREVVLAMPPAEQSLPPGYRLQPMEALNERGGGIYTLIDPSNQGQRFQAHSTSDAQAEAIRLLTNRGVMQKPAMYRSSHFPDTDNYVAHMRLNERVDAKGKPGLFIEELQSDRHQQGREKGYRDDQAARLKKLTSDEVEEMMALDRLGQNRTPEQRLRFIELANRDSTTTFGDGFLGIPDAPFRTSWPLQLFKRALRDAVADGKDWIGWTTGETQAARYDLSKQIDSISTIQHVDGGRFIDVRKDGRNIYDARYDRSGKITDASDAGTVGKTLADVIGKEMASKVLEVADTAPNKDFRGLDLKVGGEGMKGFYDTMVPKEVAKYVKQWGGQVEKQRMGKEPSKVFTDAVAKFEEAKRKYGATSQQATEAMMAIPNESGGPGVAEYWRVNITPQMREGIKKAGQALFVGGAAAVVAEDQLEQ